MSSFATKLARLKSPAPREPEKTAPERRHASGSLQRDEGPEREASLAALRQKIASIIAREPKMRTEPRERYETSSSSWIEHAFVEEPQRLGPLYVCRKPTPAGHRVGHVPVWSARTAEAGLLALLALDPSLASVDLDRALYLDTETTGLSGGTGTVPFLLGLGFFDPDAGTFVVEQVLLRKFAHEPAMVEHVRARLEAASVIVTFNGKSFDMPLLRARATMSRLPPLPERPHLDLLHVARRIHKHRLASCALAKLEDHILGRARVGDVAGADIGAIYHHYVRTGDIAALEKVVEHNSLDVVSMLALVGLYGEPQYFVEGELLSASDVAAASAVVRRAGDFDRAHALASSSIERGAGARGYRARGDIEKARGDKGRALSDYESAIAALAVLPIKGSAVAATEQSVEQRSLHLELAKLYEHHTRAYDKALEIVARGTLEVREKSAVRAQRLVRKRERTRPVESPSALSVIDDVRPGLKVRPR